MTISDVTKGPAGVDELPPALAGRYRSARHLAALVEIGRILRATNMTWPSLTNALFEAARDVARDEAAAARAAERAEWGEFPADRMLATVALLERVQPWDPTSSAPDFVRSLRAMASRHERVRLSPRQAEWLRTLLRRADEIEREQPVQTAMQQSNEVTGNVVRLRPRGRAL